jgi:hypothetical protein
VGHDLLRFLRLFRVSLRANVDFAGFAVPFLSKLHLLLMNDADVSNQSPAVSERSLESGNTNHSTLRMSLSLSLTLEWKRPGPS